MSYGMQPMPLAARNPIQTSLGMVGKPAVGGGAPGLPARDGATLDLDFTKGILDRRITFTRTSAGTRVGPNGLIESIPTNVPRFEHDPVTCQPLGLLIEEQRTNYCIYSDDFVNASWVNSAMLAFGSGSTSNATTAPDGTSNADFICAVNSNAEHGFNTFRTLGATGSTTLSVYYKVGGYTDAFLNCWDGTTDHRVVFHLNALNYSVVGGSPTATITDVGGSWRRCTMTFTAASTSAQCEVGGCINDRFFQGDGTSGVYVWGAQLEAGAFPTSYIPTTSASVARGNDRTNIRDAAFTSFWNPQFGTLCIYVTPQNVVSIDIISIGSGLNNSNRINLFCDSPNLMIEMTYGAVSQVNMNISAGVTLTKNVPNIIALSIAENKVLGCVKGGSVVSDTSVILPVGQKIFSIGIDTARGDNITTFSGVFKRITYWRYAKTSAQIKALTA